LRLLGTEQLNPGEEAWIQLELRDPTVTVRGDRYILRRPSPGETLGGGVIVDHQPKGRHKRFDQDVLQSLESLSKGTPAEILLEAALALNAAPIKEIVDRSRLETSAAETAVKELLNANSLLLLEAGAPSTTSDLLVIAMPHWSVFRDKTLQIVEAYHRSYPYRRGIPREELKSRLKLSPRVFNGFLSSLVTRGLLQESGSWIAVPEHKVVFNGQDQTKVQALNRKFEQNPFSPPSVKETQAEVGEEILNALIDMTEFVVVSADVIFRKQDYDSAVMKIRETLLHNEHITLAEVRDLLGTSRKYAQALLEHLDAIGTTMREGDTRKLRKK
jgi:selenocysteine-specific elongation factor